MATYNFQAIQAVTSFTFDCPSCGKPKRKRTFRAECTINPFNTNEDGSIKSPAEVSRQAQAQANQMVEAFKRKPLCSTCENNLSWTERGEVLSARAKAEGRSAQ